MAGTDDGAAGSIILSFVLGACAGAAAALLMAPATGDELRRKVADRVRESAEKTSEAARLTREYVEQQRRSLVEAVERGREAYQQAKSSGVTLTPTGGATL